MSVDLVLIGAVAALLAIAPYLTLQRDARRVYALADVASYALFAFAVLLAPRFGISVAESLLFSVFLLAKLSLWFAFLVTADRRDVRWSATGAALVALAVYAILVPHVLQWPVDGDEPYYLLMTESLARDHDLDLANQYAGGSSFTGRSGLVPQLGDPTGARGEQYSRHEPLLALMMVPGYLVGGLWGCVATIALFGALLVRSTLLFLEEEGVSERTRMLLFPFLAFGPPLVFYSTRAWPEVPAAFLFAEMLRGASAIARENGSMRRPWLRLALAGIGLSLLKLRFLTIAALLLLALATKSGRSATGNRRRIAPLAVALLVVLVPLVLFETISGSPFNIHQVSELVPQHPEMYFRGLFGSLLDAERGMLFRAPLWIFGLLPLLRWKETPSAYRLGLISSLLYLLLLFPRAEWDGGWSPPLRYLVVFAPLFALGAGLTVDRISRWSLFAIAAIATFANTLFGVAYPHRLFHIANGENAAGEWLSSVYHSDFSRLLPSFIRLNQAGVAASVVLVVLALLAVAARRGSWRGIADPLVPAALALLFAAGFQFGREPADLVQFEDAHVVHDGGSLYPDQWTVGRFTYRGGWTLKRGDSMSFLASGGQFTLDYSSKRGATVDVGGHRLLLPDTGGDWRSVSFDAGQRGVVRFRLLLGEATFDRMRRE